VTQKLDWRVHTSGLFEEIINSNPTTIIFRHPLTILRSLLSEVAKRAIELNDPELHRLMIRLTLYSMADPKSKDYNPEMVNELLKNDLKIGEEKEVKQDG